MSKNFVDANYRFIAAYQEVNARIIQRQQIPAEAADLTLPLSRQAIVVDHAPIPAITCSGR